MASNTTPRLTDRSLPEYRHIPGKTPHPTRSPQGHSYRLNPPENTPLPDLNRVVGSDGEDFLYGVDLFNERYWWECHEVMEQFWHASGIGTPAGHVLQAIIQCAAAHLKFTTGHPAGAMKLFVMAEGHVHQAEGTELDLDLAGLLAETRTFITGDSTVPARLLRSGTKESD
ncbi:MAG: DUF309 domain-containing protein [Gemmatimonadales bacterium]|nr:DUF309 domain-containing protein [Gemmatimonadales bacterium]